MSGNKLWYVSAARELRPGIRRATSWGILGPAVLCCAAEFMNSRPARANPFSVIWFVVNSVAPAAIVIFSFLAALLSAKPAHHFNVAIATMAIATACVAPSGIVRYNAWTG